MADGVNDIAGNLPARRDDEPDSLRDDIVDELADHLTCALSRELHSTSNETDAERNVLERFGNPRRIARRLWFDAMKEKIMSGRVQLFVSALLAVAVLAAMGMMWSLVSQNRAFNLAVLDRLDSLQTPAAAEPISLEWNLSGDSGVQSNSLPVGEMTRPYP